MFCEHILMMFVVLGIALLEQLKQVNEHIYLYNMMSHVL